MELGVWRLRAVTTAVFFALFCALAAGRAQASVFCTADVGFMTAWDYTTDAPSTAVSNLHYVFDLEGDAAATVSGTMIVVTDSKAYKVPFERMQLVQSEHNANRFYSDAQLFSLPQPEAVKYAWVDEVTTSDGKTNTCPTLPYRLPELSAEERASMTPAHPAAKNAQRTYDSLMAQFDMDLPPLDCVQPYRNVQPLGEMPTTTDYYDDLIVKNPVVEGRVDVDSEGKVLNVEILKSSGSVAFDQDAKQTYGLRKYQPQLFRCTAVVSSYYFSLKYYHR
jgi:hypothetical protein